MGKYSFKYFNNALDVTSFLNEEHIEPKDIISLQSLDNDHCWCLIFYRTWPERR